MIRVIDRGAVTAAYVGIGMAIVIAISFLLVIPIEPIFWLLALPAGMLIGYYANSRSDRRAGPIGRILANAAFAAVVTGLTLVILLLATKALFFYADNGFPDFNRVDAKTHQAIPPFCQSGADCVLARYRASGRGPDLARAGITDAPSFTAFYWSQQLSTGGTVFAITVLGGLVGGGIYAISRPRPTTAGT